MCLPVVKVCKSVVRNEQLGSSWLVSKDALNLLPTFFPSPPSLQASLHSRTLLVGLLLLPYLSVLVSTRRTLFSDLCASLRTVAVVRV